MRILLADDQSNVRFALRTLLERQPGLEIVGEATGTETLCEQVTVMHPDLLLLDWELPGGGVPGILSNLRTVHAALKVIALSGRPDARRAALGAGVDAFVSKADPPEQLLLAIRETGLGKEEEGNETC